MVLKRKFDLFLLFIFFLFSVWLMYKSFGYDNIGNSFRIARNQIGDFGLHLSLIRSFSWGNNFPVESPFFPGKALPYHYYFDLLVGMLEKTGMRIDIAFNGVSILAFTALLYLIYCLPQKIFSKSKLLGILSVVLFLFYSNLTFIDFFKEKGLSASAIKELWFLPDYINKGPFDGSLISIFFTLNVYLNQRHLIVAFVISLSIIYFLLSRLLGSKDISLKMLIIIGSILGLLSRIHTLTFFSTVVVIFSLFFFFKRLRLVLRLFVPAAIIFSFHLKDILGQDISHPFFNPGFLSLRPLSIVSFTSFWFVNLGVAFILIPLGFIFSEKKQKLIFISIFSLFIIGNIFQLSFRIDHNHSLFNIFIIFANFYIANLLVKILKKKLFGKFIFVLLLFLLTSSGVIDLMAVKNDFQFHLKDAPSNRFMQWIKESTKKEDIFLSKQEILDSVTLSGRKNYLGHNYYLSVMGYNYLERLNQVKSYFEVDTLKTFEDMKKDKIAYIVVPTKPVVDFNYHVNIKFINKNLKKIYQDNEQIVYKL